MNKHYDIFISYRRTGGAQYARILQLMFIQRGYKVFLDYDELRDGTFSERIRAAIKDATVFMPVLSAGSMARCVNENDWVRKEILQAVQEGKPIVPIDPDRTFDGVPDGVPEEVRKAVEENQHSEVSFGQLLGASVEQVIADRLVDKVGKRTAQTEKVEDFRTAQETLLKQDRHNRLMKWLGITGVVAVILVVLATCLLFWHDYQQRIALEKMRTELNLKYSTFRLQLSPQLTEGQMKAIDDILGKMSVVDDTLWMSQFECTVGQWCGMRNEPYDEQQKDMPVTGRSFDDIYLWLMELSDTTNIGFDLPSADEWEYAAHGGPHHETSLYAGCNEVDSVWYAGNSGGVAHPSNGQQGTACNSLDLFDMSGNVAELCNTAYVSGIDGACWTVCGGHYLSPADDVTASSRAEIDTNAKQPTVGFRLIIRKP